MIVLHEVNPNPRFYQGILAKIFEKKSASVRKDPRPYQLQPLERQIIDRHFSSGVIL
jgi:hypothetical protein